MYYVKYDQLLSTACFLTFCCSAIPSVTHPVMLSTITRLSSFSYLKPGLIMNSYNIFTDDDYVQWLLENHPDSLPAHVCPVDKMDTEKPPQHSTPLRHREPSQRCDLTPINSKAPSATGTQRDVCSPKSAITEFLTCPGYKPSLSSSKQKATVHTSGA